MDIIKFIFFYAVAAFWHSVAKAQYQGPCDNPSSDPICGNDSACYITTDGVSECVPLSCNADGACEEDETCIKLTPAIFCITTIPCPQFTCIKAPEKCVICPQVVPTCDPSCGNCTVTEQTCEKCATAICEDNGISTLSCPANEPSCENSCKNCEKSAIGDDFCAYAVCTDPASLKDSSSTKVRGSFVFSALSSVILVINMIIW